MKIQDYVAMANLSFFFLCGLMAIFNILNGYFFWAVFLAAVSVLNLFALWIFVDNA